MLDKSQPPLGWGPAHSTAVPGKQRSRDFRLSTHSCKRSPGGLYCMHRADRTLGRRKGLCDWARQPLGTASRGGKSQPARQGEGELQHPGPADRTSALNILYRPPQRKQHRLRLSCWDLTPHFLQSKANAKPTRPHRDPQGCYLYHLILEN